MFNRIIKLPIPLFRLFCIAFLLILTQFRCRQLIPDSDFNIDIFIIIIFESLIFA